jgi:Ca2+-binding RTX toxin-like protein
LAIFTTDTVNSDQVPASGKAVEYGSNALILTILDNIAVVSLNDYAVFSDRLGSVLFNNGSVLSAVAVGGRFEGDSSSITNNAGHSITGLTDGINFLGNGATLNNHGTVSGLTGDGVLASALSSSVVLNNDGDIAGRAAGIRINSDTSGDSVNNSGTISGGEFGLAISTELGLTTVINNGAGGVIKGPAAIATVLDGAISLTNNGTIVGQIDCNTNFASDVVINHGKIIGQVFLGPSDDVFSGRGGTSGAVFGEDGNDTLIGGNGNDMLNGGAGLDTIRGGRGKDSLFGGADHDLFDYNSIKDSLRGSKRDVINDFVRGTDDIDLKGIDAKKGVGGNQKFKFIGEHDFHDVRGELRYEDKGSKVIVQGDVNGDGKADFEILVKVGALGAGDFLL